MGTKKRAKADDREHRGALVDPWTSQHVEHLRKAQKESGFTIRQIAKDAKVSESAFKGWMYSGTTPTAENLADVEAVLKCTLRQLPALDAARELVGRWKGTGSDCAPWHPADENRDLTVQLARDYHVEFQIEQELEIVGPDLLEGVALFQTVDLDNGAIVSPWSAYDSSVRVFNGDQVVLTFCERDRPRQDIGGGILRWHRVWPNVALRGCLVATEYQLHPSRKPPTVDGCEIVRLSIAKVAENEFVGPWRELLGR